MSDKRIIANIAGTLIFLLFIPAGIIFTWHILSREHFQIESAIIPLVLVWVLTFGIPLGMILHRIRKSKNKLEITKQHQIYLEEKVSYYKNLNPSLKKRFNERLEKLFLHKYFFPLGIETVSDEMKLLVGAAMIIVSFGLRDFYFEHFDQIFITAHAYTNTQTGNIHGAETRGSGDMIFSWDNLIHGFKWPDDGDNIALHEVAHALQLNQDQKLFPYFKGHEFFEIWERYSRELIPKINEGEITFFSAYAGTNQHELFACCIERFFEQPNEFYSQYPHLFNLMKDFLRQDSRQKSNPLQYTKTPKEIFLESLSDVD